MFELLADGRWSLRIYNDDPEGVIKCGRACFVRQACCLTLWARGKDILSEAPDGEDVFVDLEVNVDEIYDHVDVPRDIYAPYRFLFGISEEIARDHQYLAARFAVRYYCGLFWDMVYNIGVGFLSPSTEIEILKDRDPVFVDDIVALKRRFPLLGIPWLEILAYIQIQPSSHFPVPLDMIGCRISVISI